MATHDYVIANQGFPAFRSDLNSALAAIVSNNSNGSSPGTTYAYQMWYDTGTNIWKMRNADNDAWISLATFNQTNDTVNFNDSAATVAGISTSASATVLTLANGSVAINPAGFVSVGGAATQGGEVRFLEDTDAGSNYTALKAGTISSNVTFTLPIADGSDGQFLKTDGSGALAFATATTSAGGSDKQIQFNNSGAFGGISMGSNGQVLSTNGTTASFTDPAGGGTDWQAVKTSGFTAVGGEGYFCNTTSAAFTVTLPSSPSIGDEVAIVDYAGTFDSNNLTVGRNSKNIQGSASDLTVATERAGFTLVFTDNTQGWLIKNN
tara:strand:- start:1078 stop:2043 length:966 start_codon:yes stop_codon:yes gene_type:complete